MDIEALRTAFTEKPAVVFQNQAAVDGRGVRLEVGGLLFGVTEGRFIPVRATTGGREVPAGYLFDGTAVVSVRWPRATDALRFANRLVLEVGEAREALAPVAAGSPWVTEVGRAVFLGASWAREPRLAALPPLPSGSVPDLTPFRDRIRGITDPYSTQGGVLMDLATNVLTGAVLADAGALDPAFAADWVDLATDTRYAGVEDRRLPGNLATDRWLSQLRDPTGAAFYGQACGRISSLGRSTDGVPRSAHFAWLDCPAGPGLSLASTRVAWSVRRVGVGFNLALEGVTEIDVVASRAGVRAFPLALANAVREVDDSPWSVRVTTADGRRVDLPSPPDDHETPPPGMVWVVLPEPLAAGQTTRLSVATSSLWFLRDGNQGDVATATDLAAPWIRPANLLAGAGTKSEVVVRLVAEDKLGVIGSGRWDTNRGTGAEWSMDWSEGLGVPVFAIGRWAHHPTPADVAHGVPDTVVHVGEAYMGDPRPVSDVARLGISWFNQVLPPYPWTQAHIVLSSGAGRSGRSGAGVLSVGGGSAPGGWDRPTLDARADQRALLGVVARQWFGSVVRPAGYRDAWIGSVLPDAYTNLAFAQIFGAEVAEEWRKVQMRTCAEVGNRVTDRFESLSVTDGRTRGCNAWLLSDGLMARAGADAVLGGVDALMRLHLGGTLTTEQVFAAIQARTPVDLSAFYEGWFEVGYIPELSATWTSAAAGRVSGTLTADVPFGRFEVPVVVTRADGAAETVWVTIKDGFGVWSSATGAAVRSVQVDPDHRIPAMARSATRARK